MMVWYAIWMNSKHPELDEQGGGGQESEQEGKVGDGASGAYERVGM